MPAMPDRSRSKTRDVFYRVILGCLAAGIVFLLLDRWRSDLALVAQAQGLLQEAAAPMGYEWQVVIEGVAAAARKMATVQLVVVLLATVGIYTFCLHVIFLEENLTSAGVIEGHPSRWSQKQRHLVNRAYFVFAVGWAAALAVVVFVHHQRMDPFGPSYGGAERFETAVTQSVMAHLLERAGDIFTWLGPIMLMFLLGFLPLCRVAALLRANAQASTGKDTDSTPDE